MQINSEKTKVMVFGNSTDEIKIKISGKYLENVRSYKYLGVVLDPGLDYNMHVDYAVGKAKRAMAKIGILIHG